MRRGLVFAWVMGSALPLASCALLFDYGDGSSESGDACGDGLDNDDDGRVDCRDADCAAVCAQICGAGIDGDVVDADGDGAADCHESSAADCANGTDDDGDGRIDAQDPGCWPLVPAVATRCASVRGGELDLPFASVAESADQIYVTGIAPTDAARAAVGGGVAIPPGTTIGTLSTITGGWDGLTIEALVQGSLTLGLAPAARTGVGTPVVAAQPLLEIAVRASELGVAGELRVRALGVEAMAATSPAASGWQLLRVTVAAGELRASLTPLPELGEGTETAVAPTPLGELGLFPESRLLLSSPSEGRTLSSGVTRLRVGLGAVDPCGATVPSTSASALTQEGLDVAVARNDAGSLCAVRVDCAPSQGLLGLSATSEDGVAWATAGTLGLASAAGVAWDDAAARFRAVMADARSGALAILESEDCREWSPVAVTGLEHASDLYAPGARTCEALAATGLSVTTSYAVRGARHEVFWVVDGVRAPQLVRAVSTDGGASFAAPEVVLELGGDFGPMVGVTAVGNDLVVSHLGGPLVEVPGVQLGILDVPRYEPVRGQFLGPSGTPGTFDRDAVRSVTAIPPAGPTARAELVVGALGDFDADGGSGRSVRFGVAHIDFGEDAP